MKDYTIKYVTYDNTTKWSCNERYFSSYRDVVFYKQRNDPAEQPKSIDISDDILNIDSQYNTYIESNNLKFKESEFKMFKDAIKIGFSLSKTNPDLKLKEEK